MSKHVHRRDKCFLSNSTAPAGEDDWWPVPEVPTLRPSCIRSTGSQKFSTQSFSVRGCCCQLSPSSPKLESPVSSQLGLAFNLEIRFPTCQDFCTCPGYFLNWDRGNVCPVSAVPGWGWDVLGWFFAARWDCRWPFAHWGRFLPSLADAPAPSPCGSAAQSAHAISITQVPAPGTESRRESKA